MTYRDLPKNLREHSLDSALIAGDTVDLVVDLPDREAGCLLLFLCDPQGRPLDPILITEVPGPPRPEVGELFAGLFAQAPDGEAAVLFARGRPGSPLFTDEDRAWHQVVIDACRAAGVRLVGSYLATVHAVRRFPDSLGMPIAGHEPWSGFSEE